VRLGRIDIAIAAGVEEDVVTPIIAVEIAITIGAIDAGASITSNRPTISIYIYTTRAIKLAIYTIAPPLPNIARPALRARRIARVVVFSIL
jgi:hypothetical protein